jgi:hypothetical protein
MNSRKDMKEALDESIRVTKVNSLMAAGTNNGGVFLKFGCKKKNKSRQRTCALTSSNNLGLEITYNF